MSNAFLYSTALRRLIDLIRSHFSVTGAAKRPGSLFCLLHPLQLSPHHRLPRLPVCMVSFSPLIFAHLFTQTK